MSAPRALVYRFATPAQWAACLLHRFDVARAGIALAPRLGLRPVRVPRSNPGAISAVAADLHHDLFWRHGSAEGPKLFGADSQGTLTGAFELDAALARSKRWILDHAWLWTATDQGVRRYDRFTLQLDLQVAINGIADIAGDGRDGVWLLVAAADGGHTLVHVNCRGRQTAHLPVPCGAERPTQLGIVERGVRLVLLAQGGTTLVIIDIASGRIVRRLQLTELASCWSAVGLAADTRNRIALWGPMAAGADPSWAVFVLDGDGDVVDSPLGDDARGMPEALRTMPRDIAIAGDALWFATGDGLWQLDDSERCVARESASVLMTPALESRESDTDRGWLRAEVSIALPPGAVLEAQFAGTSDEAIANACKQAAREPSAGAARAQQAIWDGFEPASIRRLRFVGPTAPGDPISIPLFQCKERWLWLRLEVVAPPGTAPPSIGELRILHPDASIARQLPAIFRGEQDVSDGFLRRLVGVLECTTQGVDDRIRRIGAHLDPARASDAWLRYVARWLDLPWNDGLPEAAKRSLIGNAEALLAARGTRRGFELLLRCLLGPRAVIKIVDLTVDHPPVTLGGGGRQGAKLPALLAGTAHTIPRLAGKARLGSARLPCASTDAHPLRTINPTLRVVLTTEPATATALKELVPEILDGYLPVGLALSLRWQVVASDLLSDDGGLLLDAEGPAALGDGGRVGSVVLAGRGGARIDDAGLGMGFRLS